MKQLIVFLSVILASGLLFSNIYTSIVDVKAWGGNIPESIENARAYFRYSNPGNFFRIFSPANQLLALLVLIITWKQFPEVRVTAALVLAAYILTDVFTFGFFYPRNELLFEKASLTDIKNLKQIWNEWRIANWIRSAMLAIGIGISFSVIRRVF